jgi:hypothetical protein
MMHILSFEAENFKKLRLVEITPKGRLIQITGGNGEGKTSLLDAIWATFKGAYGIPAKPVRKGADKSIEKFILGDLKTGKREILGKRTIQADRTTSIELWSADGSKYSNPQAMLNDLIGNLGFDPLEFIHMDTKQQVATLREAAKVDYDFDAATEASKEDFNARKIVNREVDRLTMELNGYTVQDGLPKDRVDESAILERIKATDEINQKARQVDDAKRDAQKTLNDVRVIITQKRLFSIEMRDRKLELERQLAEVEEKLTRVQAELDPLEVSETRIKAEVEAMPAGEYADVIALTKELQGAQAINREIDRRTKRDALDKQLQEQKREAARLSRQIEKRDEAKAAAIASAKLPVDGLTFDESTVMMDGIPVAQLGEAEQIRVSTLIAMSANPKLRVLRIMHGEALDNANLEVLAQLAEEHDFQIWMARVDTSGKVGIVLEDGQIKENHYEAEAEA